LWSGREVGVPRAWLHCPICDRELVGPYAAGLPVGGPAGPVWIEPTRDELIAKCPAHGRRPFNDPTRHPSVDFRPDER
jgi:hypothetical protein